MITGNHDNCHVMEVNRAEGSRSPVNENVNKGQILIERQQIKKIDAEMALRLGELHKMMKKEGMTESLAMIEKCTEEIGKHLQGVQLNKNENANLDKGPNKL